jgi:hypothetical protein
MIPAEIRQCLLEPHHVRSTRPLTTGMSGATLYRCEGKEPLALRRWPIGTSEGRVREIHSVISPVAMNCHWIPQYKLNRRDNQSWVTDSDGGIWELAAWVPGKPLPHDAPISLIQTGAAAIGDLHRRLASLGASIRTPEAIDQRMRRVTQLDRQLPRCLRVNLDGRVPPTVLAPLTLARDLLAGKWPQISQQINATLSPLRRCRLPVHYILRDIHREHLLFTEGAVSGIIDFDAVRIDTPAVDLARWATDFSEFAKHPGRTIDLVLAGYFGSRSLFKDEAEPDRFGLPRTITDLGVPRPDAPTADFRTLILAIAESSLWISLANWVIWLVDESRQFPDFQRVAERINRIIESVQRLPKR